MTMNRTKAYANLIRDERNQMKEDREENQNWNLSKISFNVITNSFYPRAARRLHSDRGINLPKTDRRTSCRRHHMAPCVSHSLGREIRDDLLLIFFFLNRSNLSRHSDNNKHTKELRIWLNLKRNNIANRNPRNLNQMKCVVVCISLLPSALVVVLPRIGSERQLQTLETPRHAKSLSKMCLIASFSQSDFFC